MEENLDFAALGYDIPAAREGSWRTYDVAHPQPGYFEFDWLSARYPDLYHNFALSTVCLTTELPKLIYLNGLAIADIGAGTGRSSIGLAGYARHVSAFDAYASVVDFGRKAVQAAGCSNVEYRLADRAALPLPNASMDAVMASWAVLDIYEAYRVLKPGGWLIQMGCVPGAMCGALAPTLQSSYPALLNGALPAGQLDELLDPKYPPADFVMSHAPGIDVPLVDGMHVHDFTSVSDYGSVAEAMAIFGRIYGPKAAEYLRSHNTSALASRLRISYGRVAK